jgi:predicted nuclease with TOPRIM domain
MSNHGDAGVVREVREKARELAGLLDDFSDRLRRMRQRNRQLEEEIGSFEDELERLRRDVLDAGDPSGRD